MLTLLGGVTVGIKHSPTGVSGDKLTTTKWNADHVSSGGYATELIWCATDTTVLSLLNQGATVDWTDLDLTAATSASAKAVYLQLSLTVDNGALDYILGVRRNGDTPTMYPCIRINSNVAVATDIWIDQVLVGCDSDQVIEYYLFIGGGGQADCSITVLGYWV